MSEEALSSEELDHLWATVNEDEYLRLLNKVYTSGECREDRTGVGTRGLFGERMKFDLSSYFPLLTTKRVHWKSVVHELLWMIRGSTSATELNAHGVTIWDEWAREDGSLGPIYGKQWRSWQCVRVNEEAGVAEFGLVDQLSDLVRGLKSDPFSRRHIVSAWNVGELEDMALPPCHLLFQFWVSNANKSLHCQLYQRSADIFIGLPFNVASYALLTCMLADTLGLNRGSLTWVGGDVHLYENHREQALVQLRRPIAMPPRLKRIEAKSIFDVGYEQCVLEGYTPLPSIPAPVAV